MILLDANVLLYAYDQSSPFHVTARRWLEKTLSSGTAVRLPWTTVLAFLRISTNSRALLRPLLVEEAVGIVDEWLCLPNVEILEAGEGHWTVLKALLPAAQATGPLVPDAHLAALALETGGTLCTTDRDFRRFEGLKLLNPVE